MLRISQRKMYNILVCVCFKSNAIGNWIQWQHEHIQSILIGVEISIYSANDGDNQIKFGESQKKEKKEKTNRRNYNMRLNFLMLLWLEIHVFVFFDESFVSVSVPLDEMVLISIWAVPFWRSYHFTYVFWFAVIISHIKCQLSNLFKFPPSF